MQTIDITITAALRPTIVQSTGRSVYEHVVKPFMDRFRFRTIVNIDPVGEQGVTQDDIEAIYREIFGDITSFKPESPSFPNAIQRVWRSVEAEVTFYAQDSKQILRRVPVDSIMAAFAAKPELATVSVAEMKKSGRSPAPVSWDPDYGMHVSPYYHKAVTCRPSFLRRQYVHWISTHFRDGVSAEKTMKAHDDRLGAEEKREIQAFSSQFRYGFLLLDEETAPRYVENIGRRWRLHHGFTKPQGGGISGSWSQQRRRLFSKKYLRLWKQVRGRQLRRLWARITGRSPGGDAD